MLPQSTAHFHLPGLFEFYELYSRFLPLYGNHPEYFYDWCDIGSIYGAPEGCLWGGGRTGSGTAETEEVLELLKTYGISGRLTFSNSLLQKEHLPDRKCNKLCALFEKSAFGVNSSHAEKSSFGVNSSHAEKSSLGGVYNGVIVHSELLTEYLKKNYPDLYLVSSTTKVLTEAADFIAELKRPEFAYVVPDFRLNKNFNLLKALPQELKDKTEFLCNEGCWTGCKDRKACYENVSRKNLGEECKEHLCRAPGGNKGYVFSEAMKNPAFIGAEDIQKVYMPAGFTNFKIEGRELGSAVVLEFLLYYLVKPEYQLKVREAIYLDSMLDLF